VPERAFAKAYLFLKLQPRKLHVNYVQIGFRIAMSVLIKRTVLRVRATTLLKPSQRVSTHAIPANCHASNAWEQLQTALTAPQGEH
jgi:hypothetical protein